MGLQIITFLHQSHLFKKKHLQTNEKWNISINILIPDTDPFFNQSEKKTNND